ncbi:peptide/nickel transport system substrate-binding protein [Mesorhizobium albiziae]|uniref:Peptide/nickel transport system substrate-binding protein n=1 Tax=Neomesorhizobium albiziae TaxID=335020 RepID=A0A1I3YY81_9HYPH|nr:ABC transporter substrate-binding protein [Mesorhizobium albiziae]GLS33194.1 peptide ABC transporter substrate-binding protein [Mesorhizobium albiziae]SFK36834.1 peptide/nickel transport system substrate-binding protein [Mesorhizobium albiziae]
MMNRRTALGVIASALVPVTARAAGMEPTFLQPRLDDKSLPPMAERLPKVPRLVNVGAMGREPGTYGGEVRTLIGSQKDIRLMTINGYARLVGFDEKLGLHADILESFEAVGDRVFTFKIREGHKWSDGSLLTSEDFRYCFEDVLMNEDLSSGGLPTSMMVDGNAPLFEILDTLTVRFSWEGANPDFLPSLAAAQPLGLVLPAAYLKQFHKKYQDPDELEKLMKKNKAKKWTALHIRMSRQYRPENPELPTLDPWQNMTKPPADQFVFERNPFFHRVDENGLQLPYIDKFILNVSSSSIIPAKSGAGDSDLQSVGLDFADYTFLKDAEKRYPLKVQLWKRTQGSRLALLPNLNAGDPTWRKLLQDVRMRRALSLAINREEINKAVFYGLGRESADTILPESPLFQQSFADAWAAYDPAKAAALLDEVGLEQRGDDGIRILPDGRAAQIVVETAGESIIETDALELITDHWREVGIALFIRTSQRDVFRSRAMGGEIMMSMWSGIDNGVPTADMNPKQLAPTADDQLQWPVWGAHYISHGQVGEPPDLPAAAELVELVRQWRRSAEMPERAKVWTSMLTLYTDQVFSIGLVNSTLQPVLCTSRLRNLPKEGLYGFDPTSYLGVYMPDTFWLAGEA